MIEPTSRQGRKQVKLHTLRPWLVTTQIVADGTQCSTQHSSCAVHMDQLVKLNYQVEDLHTDASPADPVFRIAPVLNNHASS
jgi:hypothetical protein